jgi:hypothetical protein
MRTSCLDCARKHISQAIVLLIEAKMGYPLHFWLAMGHLAEAEAESITKHPEISHLIRSERVMLMENVTFSLAKKDTEEINANDDSESVLEVAFDDDVDLMGIIELITKKEILDGEGDIDQ